METRNDKSGKGVVGVDVARGTYARGKRDIRWYRLRRMLPPIDDDDTLKRELCTPRFKVSDKTTILIEPK